jgi:hypothetical protein
MMIGFSPMSYLTAMKDRFLNDFVAEEPIDPVQKTPLQIVNSNGRDENY